MNPKISIIVPSYNEEKNIKKCIDSICNQTFDDFEILCVDDSSTDNTFNIITNLSNKDKRIRPLMNPGKGVSSARNFGLQNAKGEYIGFVDSDDTVQPQMYEFLYRAIVENDADYSFCEFTRGEKFCFEKYEYQSSLYKIESLKDSENFHANETIVSCVWNKLYKKELLATILFKNYTVAEDTRFCIDVLLNNDIERIAYLNIPLYNYFTNPNSVTHNLDDNKMYQNLSARFEFFVLLKDKFKKYSYYHLEQGFYYLIKYKRKYGFFDKKIRKKVNNLFWSNLPKYLRSPYAGLFDKLYVVCSYCFPHIASYLYK